MAEPESDAAPDACPSDVRVPAQAQEANVEEPRVAGQPSTPTTATHAGNDTTASSAAAGEGTPTRKRARDPLDHPPFKLSRLRPLDLAGIFDACRGFMWRAILT
jgi:hypothetical protein